MNIQQRAAEIRATFEPSRALLLAGHSNENAMRKLLDTVQARVNAAEATTPEALHALENANAKLAYAKQRLKYIRQDFAGCAVAIAEAEAAAGDCDGLTT